MDRHAIWDHTVAQRLALAEILRSLAPEQWERPSLCAGWRVQDVAAHVILSPQASWRVTLGMLPQVRHGYHEMIFRESLRRGRLGRDAILDQFAEYATVRRSPALTSWVEPLLDALVHTQDIVRPLGIEHHMVPEAAAVAASRARLLRMTPRRLRAVRLVATDVDWVRGRGPVIEGPMEELLMLSAGREARSDRLAGRVSLVA